MKLDARAEAFRKGTVTRNAKIDAEICVIEVVNVSEIMTNVSGVVEMPFYVNAFEFDLKHS